MLRSSCDTVQVRLIGKSGLVAEAVPHSDLKFAGCTCWVPTSVVPAGGGGATPVALVCTEPSLKK